jgi:hypothetical protein
MNSRKEMEDNVINLFTSSVENILEIALACSRAELHLNDADRIKFLSKMQSVDKSSIYLKWKKIHKTNQRFTSVHRNLPLVLTMIYKISKITSDEFDSLYENNDLNHFTLDKRFHMNNIQRVSNKETFL